MVSRKQTIAVILAFLTASIAVGQLRIVTFNTANNGDNPPNGNVRAGLDTVLAAIGNQAVGGIVKPIDVLSLQEQQSMASTTQQVVNTLNGIYGPGTYARGSINANTSGGGRVGIVYNTQTVQLIQEAPFSSVNSSGAARQPMRYRLRPIGYDASADFYVYSNHYKASTGGTNENRREVEATATRANADGLGQGAHIIYTGDFNIQSSSEDMYQTLLSAGAGQAFDPINSPGTWHNSSALRRTHTQSPYDTSKGIPDLIGGGMDDRFDFQLVSGELLDNEGLSYIPNSYRAFGNNGSHSLNDAVNDSSNNALPTDVLEALAGVSDHLPVVADYQLPASLSVTTGTVPATILRGTNLTLPVTVFNGANVVAANGADELDFTLTATGALAANETGMDAPLGGGVPFFIPVDTGAIGFRTGMVQVSSTSQAVANNNFSQSVNYTVVVNSQPSFDGLLDIDSLSIEFGIVAPGSTQSHEYAVHNLMGFFADLEITNLIENGDAALSSGVSQGVVLETGRSQTFTATLDTSTSGLFDKFVFIQTTDTNVAGTVGGDGLSLLLRGGVALPGDANLDGSVDISDFHIWNSNRLSAEGGWSSGDFNFDGDITTADFEIWNQNKFTSLGSPALVPEPSRFVWLASALAGMFLTGTKGRRRRKQP